MNLWKRLSPSPREVKTLTSIPEGRPCGRVRRLDDLIKQSMVVSSHLDGDTTPATPVFQQGFGSQIICVQAVLPGDSLLGLFHVGSHYALFLNGYSGSVFVRRERPEGGWTYTCQPHMDWSIEASGATKSWQSDQTTPLQAHIFRTTCFSTVYCGALVSVNRYKALSELTDPKYQNILPHDGPVRPLLSGLAWPWYTICIPVCRTLYGLQAEEKRKGWYHLGRRYAVCYGQNDTLLYRREEVTDGGWSYVSLPTTLWKLAPNDFVDEQGFICLMLEHKPKWGRAYTESHRLFQVWTGFRKYTGKMTHKS